MKNTGARVFSVYIDQGIMVKQSCEEASFIFQDDCRLGGGEETLLKSEKYVKCILT